MAYAAKESTLPAEMKSMKHSKPQHDISSDDSANLQQNSSEFVLYDEGGMYDHLKRLVIRRFSNSSEQNKRKETEPVSCVFTANSDEFFPYDLKGEFPQFFIRKAERELGETPENRKRATQDLKELIIKHKKNFKTDEFFLVLFLRVKKFEAPRAFELMENFYKFKVNVYDLNPIDMELFKRHMKTTVFTILPYRDSLGRGIHITKMRFYDPNLMPVKEMLSMNAVSLLKLLDDVINQIAGFLVIMDFGDISLRWLSHLGIKNLKHYLFLYFSALPMRYQEIHFVNENILFKPVFQLIMALSTKKIKERIHFHGKNMKSLHKYISPAILPPEYGGTLKEEEIILDADEIMANRALN